MYSGGQNYSGSTTNNLLMNKAYSSGIGIGSNNLPGSSAAPPYSSTLNYYGNVGGVMNNGTSGGQMYSSH